MLPNEFVIRMKSLLGDEAEDFFRAMEDDDAVRAIRLNPRKIERERFLEKTSLSLAPIPYTERGFTVANADAIGNLPSHHAGMFYVQDPGAMAPVCALPLREGMRVLDLCAAPGGKSGQLADGIGESGSLLSNEFVPKRAKTVVSNFERLGIRNAVVTSLDTAVFQEWYDAWFDAVVVDAPCSGEGMFRKNEEAIAEWSPANVLACAARQRVILNNAAPLVRDGGYLLYATCTFSTEENEESVAAFLAAHPDYSLAEMPDALVACTAPGIPVTEGIDFTLCRRFYPHRAPGEGQFLALFRRKTNDAPRVKFRDARKPLSKEESRVVSAFLQDTLTEMPEAEAAKVGDNVVLLPRQIAVPPYAVFSAGVLLGTIEKGIVFPSHQFFSAYGGQFRQKEHLAAEDERVRRYLLGEEIEAKEAEKGWCAILYEGAALGGGKASGGKIKNHYPKGIRIKK